MKNEDQEILYRIKLTYSNGNTYYFKGGKLYPTLKGPRRIVTSLISEEMHRRRWYDKRRKADPDGTFTERIQTTKVEIVPFVLNQVNDNSRAILPEGKFVYECKDEEA